VRARINHVPEYLAPGVYVEETSYRSKSIEGVSTITRGFFGTIRRGGDTIAMAAAVLVLGVLLGVVASIAVDKARRRRQVPPPP
jgi:phage tail sheath protein FI